MDKKETAALLEILRAAYPATFRQMSGGEKKAMLQVWQFAFRDDPGDCVAVALREYIQNNRYPPTIAGVRAYMDMLTENTDEELLDEAWSAVCGNIRFEDLSRENRIFFCSQEQIDQYGFEAGTLKTVFAGQHKRAIGAIRQRIKIRRVAKEQLPPALLKALEDRHAGRRLANND